MPGDAVPAAEERQRDADRSQSAILAAAGDEFAEHGLGGARMHRSAARAGVNKRGMYYCFRAKARNERLLHRGVVILGSVLRN